MRISLVALVVYLFLFGGVLILTFHDFMNSIPVLQIGLSSAYINLIVIALSFFGLLKTLWHIIKFEKSSSKRNVVRG